MANPLNNAVDQAIINNGFSTVFDLAYQTAKSIVFISSNF